MQKLNTNKKYLQQEIKKINNRLLFLTNTPQDIELKKILINTLRDLQRQLQIIL